MRLHHHVCTVCIVCHVSAAWMFMFVFLFFVFHFFFIFCFVLFHFFHNLDLEIDTDGNGVGLHTPLDNRTSFLPDYLFKAPKRSRHKRQADQYEYTPTKTRCPLLLVADYRFFQEMGSGNTKTTINYLVRCFIFISHFTFPAPPANQPVQCAHSTCMILIAILSLISDKFNRSCAQNL